MPCVEQTKHGTSPAARSARHGIGERLGTHRERLVVIDDALAVLADTGDAQSLRDARVGLGGEVGDEARRVAVGVDGAVRRPPPCRQDRNECRLAGRPLDHAATVAAGRETLREVEQLAHPVEHERLQLRRSGRGDPAHAVDVESGGEQIAEHGGVARVGGEVGEERGVEPVRRAAQHDLVDVGQHVAELDDRRTAGCAGSIARISPGATSGLTRRSASRSR
ncbi:MAG: hypothetical protein WKF58_07825 [Ilumatobacteraceae bacterium]